MSVCHKMFALMQFSSLTTYIRVLGKIMDQHIKVLLYSYPGDKVLQNRKNMGQICPLLLTRIMTLSLDWRTIIHWNVGPPFYQKPWYMWSCCKIAGTTFHCMVVLQSRGQDFKSCWSLMKPGSQSATLNCKVSAIIERTTRYWFSVHFLEGIKEKDKCD